MTVRGKIDLKGLEAWLEDLAAAGNDINAAAARAIEAGQEVALKGMQRRAPKDTHNLEEHLVITKVRIDGNFVYGEVGLIGADADTARYGNAQEYGTSNMAAQPYIRPTMQGDKGKIRKAMRVVLEKEGKL